MGSTRLDLGPGQGVLAPGRRRHRVLLALGLAAAGLAFPAGACTQRSVAPGDRLGARIAAIACAEHERWYSPFIDDQGRLASMQVSEAESTALRDGTPAWRRVAQYWRNSGVRWPSPLLPDGAQCSAAGTLEETPSAVALCRTFLVDAPWSAVFVSYVLVQAGVPGFAPSARHIDFVRAAHAGAGPFRLVDPEAEPPAVGDLLCFVRQAGTVFGYAGLRGWLDAHPFASLGMHCDVVVSTDGPHARLVGGNVLQGVTMRLLATNRAGRFWALPRTAGSDAPCHPDRPGACNLNRQDWAALLKLDPTLKPLAPVPAPAGRCCIACPLPMPPDVVRCDPEPQPSS